MRTRPKTVILGTGCELPSRVMTNAEIERFVNTTEQWITVRTGIRERRILEEGKGTADMAYDASVRALRDSGVEAKDLDAIIVGTCTPDYPMPSSACVLENLLGVKRAFSLDVNAACCGFLSALSIADAYIRTGGIRTALVVGSDALSRLVNWEDRSTCILFGDGAGAVVVGSSTQGNKGILSRRLRSDGSYVKSLYVPAGGSLNPATLETVRKKEHTICMDGKEVFKVAVRILEEISREALEEAQVNVDQLSLVVPHQANLRIITAFVERLGVPMEKVVVNLDRYGNTSAASVPVALDEARRQGRIHSGDIVLLNAVGAGFIAGAAVIRF